MNSFIKSLSVWKLFSYAVKLWWVHFTFFYLPKTCISTFRRDVCFCLFCAMHVYVPASSNRCNCSITSVPLLYALCRRLMGKVWPSVDKQKPILFCVYFIFETRFKGKTCHHYLNIMWFITTVHGHRDKIKIGDNCCHTIYNFGGSIAITFNF